MHEWILYFFLIAGLFVFRIFNLNSYLLAFSRIKELPRMHEWILYFFFDCRFICFPDF